MVQLGDIAAGLGQGLQVGIQAGQRQRGLELQERAVGVQEEQVRLSGLQRLKEIEDTTLRLAAEGFKNAEDDEAKKRLYDTVFAPAISKDRLSQLDALLESVPSKNAAAMADTRITAATARAFAKELDISTEDAARALGLIPPNADANSVKEYKFAVENGFPGTFTEWMRENPRGQVFNIGDSQRLPAPPEGTIWKMGSDGQLVFDERGAPVAIPFKGGTVDNKARDGIAAIDDMLTSVYDALGDPRLDVSVGAVGNLLSFIPGSPQFAFTQKIKQVNGQAFLFAFGRLKGGGHITEIEGKKAAESIGRFEQAQDVDSFVDSYRDVVSQLLRYRSRILERTPSIDDPPPIPEPPARATGDNSLKPLMQNGVQRTYQGKPVFVRPDGSLTTDGG